MVLISTGGDVMAWSGGRLIHWRRWIWAQWFLELNHAQSSSDFGVLLLVYFFTQMNYIFRLQSSAKLSV